MFAEELFTPAVSATAIQTSAVKKPTDFGIAHRFTRQEGV
jgi:hypothetical protein